MILSGFWGIHSRHLKKKYLSKEFSLLFQIFVFWEKLEIQVPPEVSLS